jgi:hypothetical protein
MKILQNILIVLLIAIIVYLFFFRKPESILIPDIHYKTDTFRIKEPYPVPVPYPVSVDPKTVIIHVKDTAAIDSLTLLLSEKDILIQGLHSTITVSQDFLKQFPKNPKLIELNLSKDTLGVSTLGLDGIPSRSNYPIYLSEFAYRWTNQGLTKSTVKPSPAPKTPIQLWGGGGLNLIYLSPTLDFTAEKDWARIRLFGDIRVGLLNKNATSLNIGLKRNIR